MNNRLSVRRFLASLLALCLAAGFVCCTPAEVPSSSVSPLPASSALPVSEPASEPASAPVSSACSEPCRTDDFADALFVGDSRIQCFRDYLNLPDVRFFCASGLTVRSAFTLPVVDPETEKSPKISGVDGLIPVTEAIQNDPDFARVYLMFGFNELGWDFPYIFIQDYEKLIDFIRTVNPDAKIYVQSILPVTQKHADRGGYETNDRIFEFNETIERMCHELDLTYLDVNAVLSDENGALPENASLDGVHPGYKYCSRWEDYLAAQSGE